MVKHILENHRPHVWNGLRGLETRLVSMTLILFAPSVTLQFHQTVPYCSISVPEDNCIYKYQPLVLSNSLIFIEEERLIFFLKSENCKKYYV